MYIREPKIATIVFDAVFAFLLSNNSRLFRF